LVIRMEMTLTIKEYRTFETCFLYTIYVWLETRKFLLKYGTAFHQLLYFISILWNVESSFPRVCTDKGYQPTNRMSW
jgi:hypothetical protein